MFKFFRAFILSIIVFGALVFAATTYIGYRYLPTFAERVSPKNPKVVVKKKKAKTAPAISAEADSPVDQDQAILQAELDKEIPEEIEIPTEEVVAQLDYFDHIVEVQKSISEPSLCKILCERPHFSIPANSNMTTVINKYFEKEQNRSFEDPGFRMAVLEVQLVSDIFPKPLRQLMLEVDKMDSLSEMDKVAWVARAEIEMAKFVFNLNNERSEGRKNEKVLVEMRKLRKKCSPKAADEIEVACQNINIANW